MPRGGGFLQYRRREPAYAPVEERVGNYREFVIPLDEITVGQQGARCIDCGVPYCHFACPVVNVIPDWNDLVARSDWQRAIEVLHSTNNFPEFTGRVCPAPCEEACTLNLHDSPVAIKTIEYSIIEKAFANRWIEPFIGSRRSGQQVAVVGSGPSGLACAQQLARAGTPGRRLREERQDRRVAAVRHPGLQARKERRGPPSLPDAGRGCRIQGEHEYRRGRIHRRDQGALRRRRADRRRREPEGSGRAGA